VARQRATHGGGGVTRTVQHSDESPHAPNREAGWRAIRHHRVLFLVGNAFLIAALILVPLWLLDPTELLGVSIWEKPLKFFISTGIFCLTYSWLSAHLTRWPRIIRWAGSVIAVSLVIEMVAITGAAAAGTTSHFNVSTPLATFVWAVMATFINAVLVATIVLSVLILFERDEPLTLRLGLGLGSGITAVGMGLAFLMVTPTEAQLLAPQGIFGAHAVGVPDGGPGLPFLSWSTVAGDLRVGHFFGLHAIQVAIAILLVQRQLPRGFQLPAVLVGNLAYLGFVLITTGQALRAEPFTAPGRETLLQLGLLAVVSLASFGALALRERRQVRAAE
jgi:hypothetical protein